MRLPRVLLVGVLLGMLGVAPVGARSVRPGDGFVALPGSAPNLHGARLLGAMSGSRTLSVALALRLRNRARLDALVRAEYTPGSPLFHRFLRPAQFAASFAPSPTQRGRIADWLAERGLRVVARPRNGLEIVAQGTTATVERAFQTPIGRFRRGGSTFYANARAPRLPSAFGGTVMAVSGLDSIPRVHPSDLPVLPRVPALPNADPKGLTPAALAALYDLQPIYNAGDLGQGQTIALFQLSDFQTQNITTYDSQFGLPAPNIERVPVVAGTQTGAALTPNEDECELDIEVVHSVVPAAKILVYEGHAALPIYNQIVSDDRATVISTSYGAAEAHQMLAGPNPEGFLLAQDQLFEEAAAQGQGVFGPAGDSGAYDAAENPNDPHRSTPQVDFPASDPWVTAVGSTTLQPDGTTEVPWAEGTVSDPSATGGGLSAVFKEPWYQKGPGVTNAYTNGMRQVPDIAAYGGDLKTGRASYVTSGGSTGWQEMVGTSASTPFVAGIAALMNQYLGQTIGFLNPTLYALGQHAGDFPAVPFYDVVSGNNLLYPATPGWDLASGWGTVDGAALLDDLQALGPSIVHPIDLRPTLSIALTKGPTDSSLTSVRRGQTIYVRGSLAVWAAANGTPATYTLTVQGPKTLLQKSGSLELRWTGRETMRAVTRRVRIPRSTPRGNYVATFTVEAGGATFTATQRLRVMRQTKKGAG